MHAAYYGSHSMASAEASLAQGFARELRKGLLDLALLCHLAEGPAHGYALIAALKETGVMAPTGAEATVYQALQRLARQDLATAEWTSPDKSDEARPRKVYRITRRGLAARRAMGEEWRDVKKTIDSLLEGSS